jgi:hypothetical protein
MSYQNEISAEYLETFKLSLFEPFSDYLMGSAGETSFQLSLLDIVRFAGHACPSVTGAFLISRSAIENLYPDTLVGIRGQIQIDIPDSATKGATGPMANVFGYITGAWAQTGFGGFQGGAFSRRDLLCFDSKKVQPGTFRFTRKDNGAFVDIVYQPEMVKIDIDPAMPFQLQWRHKIKAILENPNLAIKILPQQN